MKVPKHIQEKLHRLAKLSAEKDTLSAELEAYFKKRGIMPFDLHGGQLDVTGTEFPDYISELNKGNDITDEMVIYLENYF